MVEYNVMSSSTGRKKVIAALLLAVALTGAAAALLLNANRIIKARIEAALGENFALERITVGLGGVDAYGIQLKSGGQTVLKADKLTLRVSLWGILQKRYVASSITVENPFISLVIEKNSGLRNPFAALSGPRSGAAARTPGGAVPPFEIRRIRIEGGVLRLKDERLPLPYQTVELHPRRILFDDFSYPFADKDSRLSVDALVQGKLAAGEVKLDGTVNLKTQGAKLTAVAERLSLVDEGGKGPAVKAGKVAFTLASAPEQPRHYAIAELAVERPFARIEGDADDELITPLTLLGGEAPLNGTGRKNGSGGKKAARLEIKKITITGGELLYVDHKVSRPPHATRLTSIAWHITDMAFPFDSRWTSYTFSAAVPGPGGSAGLNPAELKWQGKTVCATLDTDAKVTLSGLDITGLKPYYRKKGDAEVTRGTLDMTISLTVLDKTINGPGRAVLKDLSFASGTGLGDRFLGAPRSLVIKLLQSGNDEIGLDFVIEGNLSDPKFSITERLVTRLTLGLAKGLGLTVVDAGKSVVELGVKGVGQVGKGIIGVGKGVQGIFKKEKH